MSWFNVDKEGLAAILERRGKTFAIFELIANAWDASPASVSVTLAAIPGEPAAELVVTDDSAEGWDNLDHAFTMFAPSNRGRDAAKRGRFNLGEKLALAISREATIATMAGTLQFEPVGTVRRYPSRKLALGTRVRCVLKMTRDEIAMALADLGRIIPPVPTLLNGGAIVTPHLIGTFTASLPTEFAQADGTLRRSMRKCVVNAYESDLNHAGGSGAGDVLEMGIPVAPGDWPWRLDVSQKIPQGMERDGGLSEGFRRALQTAAVNALHATLPEDQAAAPWVQQVLGDSRATAETVGAIVRKQFGDKALISTPTDPAANANASAQGYTLVSGGALSADAWANVRKHQALIPSARAFPSPTPAQLAGAADANAGKCPTCGKPA